METSIWGNSRQTGGDAMTETESLVNDCAEVKESFQFTERLKNRCVGRSKRDLLVQLTKYLEVR